jgi:hypothetical protein
MHSVFICCRLSLALAAWLCIAQVKTSLKALFTFLPHPPRKSRKFLHIIVFLDPPPFGIAHQRCKSRSLSPQIWAPQKLSNAFHFLMGCFKLDASVKTHKDDKDHASDTAHQNIFRLTQAIVKGTQCMNITLCEFPTNILVCQ